MSWITTIKPIYKYGLLLVASLLLVYGLVLYDSARYNHGYNAAKLEAMKKYTLEQSELKKEFERRIEALTKELDNAMKQSADNRDRAIELQKLLDTEPNIKEVIREIEVIRDDCSDIPAYGRVLHTLIGQPPTITTRPTK